MKNTIILIVLSSMIIFGFQSCADKINNNPSLDEKILLLDILEKLLDKVNNLSDLNTKDLEKELKNVTDLDVIKEIFKL